MQSNPLSRTSSAASISSDDAARRTRKRFTSVQLMMLEQLFHQTSHPTREEREAVAQTAGMYVNIFPPKQHFTSTVVLGHGIALTHVFLAFREMKSVTIWFQNKRQTERKVALHHATNPSTEGQRLASFPSSSSLSPPSTSSHSMTPPHPRPSLDRVAARSESRLPPPRTPTKPHNPQASLWDNMPSSPLAAPASPPSRDLVEFMGSSRTLEWACAAARLAGKDGRGPTAPGRSRGGDAKGDAGDETEEDDVEAVTPDGSLGSGDVAWQEKRRVPTPPQRWKLDAPVGSKIVKDVPEDDDMMRAALTLCGLGQRSR
ncbi:homeodomain transcription factor [Melanogaster broomeanus]|nr:homeodomain transcription factor [Melanogaster broomeanus]